MSDKSDMPAALTPVTMSELAKELKLIRRISLKSGPLFHGLPEVLPDLIDVTISNIFANGEAEVQRRAGADRAASENFDSLKIRHDGQVHDLFFLHFQGRPLATPGKILNLGKGVERTRIDPDFTDPAIHVWMPVPDIFGDDPQAAIAATHMALARKTPEGRDYLKMFRENCVKSYGFRMQEQARENSIFANDNPAPFDPVEAALHAVKRDLKAKGLSDEDVAEKLKDFKGRIRIIHRPSDPKKPPQP